MQWNRHIEADITNQRVGLTLERTVYSEPNRAADAIPLSRPSEILHRSVCKVNERERDQAQALAGIE